MNIKEIARQLIDGLEEEYSPEQKQYIEKRLKEIEEEYNLSDESLNELCWANSCEMFSCIFDRKPLDLSEFDCN